MKRITIEQLHAAVPTSTHEDIERLLQSTALFEGVDVEHDAEGVSWEGGPTRAKVYIALTKALEETPPEATATPPEEPPKDPVVSPKTLVKLPEASRWLGETIHTMDVEQIVQQGIESAIYYPHEIERVKQCDVAAMARVLRDAPLQTVSDLLFLAQREAGLRSLSAFLSMIVERRTRDARTHTHTWEPSKYPDVHRCSSCGSMGEVKGKSNSIKPIRCAKSGCASDAVKRVKTGKRVEWVCAKHSTPR